MSGHRAIACLFGFGSVASAIAFVTLLFPGTILDRLWLLNPEGYDGLLRWGPVGVVFMAIVCTVCTTILIGLWKGRPWGRALAIVGLSINLISDVLTAILRQRLATLIGVPIALALIIYLLRSRRVSSTAP
jgi:hypothetical protein